MSWLSGYRRLSPRYERNPRNYLAFLGLAAVLPPHHIGHNRRLYAGQRSSWSEGVPLVQGHPFRVEPVSP